MIVFQSTLASRIASVASDVGARAISPHLVDPDFDLIKVVAAALGQVVAGA